MLDAAPFLTKIKMAREYSIYRSAPQESGLVITQRRKPAPYGLRFSKVLAARAKCFPVMRNYEHNHRGSNK